MICPLCLHKFGYLKLNKLDKVNKQFEFNCPECQVRLNNSPTQKIATRMKLYFIGGFVSIFLIVFIGSFFRGAAISSIEECLMLISGGGGFLLGYLELKKLDRDIYYEKVD